MSGIYGWSTGVGGVHYHRLYEPLRVAGQEGIPCATGNKLSDVECDAYDTILTHMLWDEINSGAWEALAAHGQHRMIFDIDDVMWAPDWQPFKDHYTDEVMQRVYRNIEIAHVVTTPSEYIAEALSSLHSNIHYVPNTVPESVLQIQKIANSRNYKTIGYQGSPSHQMDFTEDLFKQLVKFLHKHPNWKMVMYGPDSSETEGWPRGQIEVVPWQKPGMNYYLSLDLDVGIGPLADTEFNRGKSALRAIEYSALGIVPVLQDQIEYRKYVHEARTGLLIQDDKQWLDHLTYLAENPITLETLSQEARKRAEEWTTEASIMNWVGAWNSV